MWSSEIATRTIGGHGVELTLYEAGEGPLVVLCHGFPELAYSWRHQIGALASAGYRVIAPDQRGYGRSGRPPEIEAYDISNLTDDVISILDDAGADEAVLVGHDWGSMVVWQTALLHPGRVRGVVGMSVPFMPRGSAPPVALMRQLFAGAFFYIVYFQEPGVADAELAADPAATMRRLLAMSVDNADPDAAADDGRGFVARLSEPASLPSWLSPEELDFYVEEFRRTGFTGGLNWYRNLDRSWELTPQLDGAKVTAPSLFVGGAKDPVLVMADPAASEAWLSDHRGNVLLDGAGHWVQQEKPAEVNAALLRFLEGLEGLEGTGAAGAGGRRQG